MLQIFGVLNYNDKDEYFFLNIKAFDKGDAIKMNKTKIHKPFFVLTFIIGITTISSTFLFLLSFILSFEQRCLKQLKTESIKKREIAMKMNKKTEFTEIPSLYSELFQQK